MENSAGNAVGNAAGNSVGNSVGNTVGNSMGKILWEMLQFLRDLKMVKKHRYWQFLHIFAVFKPLTGTKTF